MKGVTTAPRKNLSRSLFLRTLGLCHVATGLASLRFARALYGERGLQPLGHVDLDGFVPLFWLVGSAGATDRILELAACAQILLGSVLLVDDGFCHAAVPLGLYLIQASLVNAPTPFLSSYGWEWQLCEASLLAAFACPILERPTRRSEDYRPPHGGMYSVAYPWLVRLAAFRVMWGAGMSKLGTNASDCWSVAGGLSCTSTHYTTMPLPNPLAYFFHKLPFRFHQFEVLFNHFAELICPYGLIMPYAPRVRTFAALASIAYMAAIISTGTYSIINWITVVFLIGSLDDGFLSGMLSRPAGQNHSASAHEAPKTSPSDVSVSASAEPGARPKSLLERTFLFLSTMLRCAFAVVVLVKTRHPIRESLSPSPWLQQYDEYHIAPAYGVFGFVNRRRLSPVMEAWTGNATDDGAKAPGEAAPSPSSSWMELELNCLPGRVGSLPCVPPFPGYHYRLDWDVWIRVTASLEHPRSDRTNFIPPSLAMALSRLLLEEGGEGAASDVDGRCFFRDVPAAAPARIRLSLYEYEYTDMWTLATTGRWWKRSRVPGTGSVFIDRDVARYISRGRYPVPNHAIPYRRRDAILVIIICAWIAGLVCNSMPSVVFASLSFWAQWKSVNAPSFVGFAFLACSLAAAAGGRLREWSSWRNNERTSPIVSKSE